MAQVEWAPRQTVVAIPLPTGPVDGDRPRRRGRHGTQLLGKLPSGLVDELLAEGERIDYPAGSIIYREGAAPRAVLVVEGLLRVYMTSPEGRQVTVRYARDAEVLGIAVLPSTRSVRCGSGWQRTCWIWRRRSSARMAGWWRRCRSRSLPMRSDQSGRSWPVSCVSPALRGW